jgi:predicted AAA+ superfamily ATPase
MSETPAAFNARNSDPKQIAQSFVKPDDFEKILEFQSKVLVGPRGIGKTTILKLLTPSGLYELQKRSDFKHLNLDHVPLYIPADTLWKGEASAFENMQSFP